MDTCYGDIISRLIELSPILKEATEYGKGIRILKQDLFETIISFIISANNNIKRIQLIIEKLCLYLGEKTPYGYAFPTKKTLSSVDAAFFRQIGAGYRADYLQHTAKMLFNDFDLEQLKSMDTASARKKLTELKGVGAKVADCILLFGLSRYDVFPVDIWIKKVYHKYYECGLPHSQIADFFVNKFQNLSGFAQQYLYYYLRNIDK
jgi:N-glycosylase/DNA lyase